MIVTYIANGYNVIIVRLKFARNFALKRIGMMKIKTVR